MWQEAKANEKRIREMMVDHRKRAERRRAYFESRLGDPQQLIRVIGSSTKLYPDAEQFYYHENPKNLMPWQANPDIKIDRFDGRSLLDFVPEANVGANLQNISREDREMQDELNFERYHDLIEAERLNVTESDRLQKVDEEWTQLLDRHQAKLALIKDEKKTSSSSNTKSRNFGFDYGTNKVAADEDAEEDDAYDDEKESQLLKEADILQYVDDLTDKDKEILNKMSGKYGIHSYARLLRVAKKDRDEELRSLKRKQREGKPKDGSRNSRRNERRRRRRHRRDDQQDDSRYKRRYSPTYEPYKNNSDDSSSSEFDDEPESTNSDFVIEFGSSAPEEGNNKDHTDNQEANDSQKSQPASVCIEKKLTPMEKLKLKMRAGLEKSIVSNEKDRRQKEREKEAAQLQELAKSQGLPANAYLRPDPPMRDSSSSNQGPSGRYRSPSSDGSVSPKAALQKSNRSPSPKPRKRSPSPSYAHHRSRSRNRKRYRSPSPRKRSTSRDRHRSHHRSYSNRDHRQHSRSRSPPRRKRHYHSPSLSDDEDRSQSHKHSKSSSHSKQRERGSRR